MASNADKPWWTGEGSGDPKTLNIVKNPPVPSDLSQIPIRIEIGVTSRVRLVEETFKPTISYTAPYIYPTDLFNYQTLVPNIATLVWEYVNSEKQNGAIVQMHCAIWLDNVTHPWVSSGVVRLPKGHRDTQLSNEELTSSQVILDHITGNILDVKNTAKY